MIEQDNNQETRTSSPPVPSHPKVISTLGDGPDCQQEQSGIMERISQKQMRTPQFSPLSRSELLQQIVNYNHNSKDLEYELKLENPTPEDLLTIARHEERLWQHFALCAPSYSDDFRGGTQDYPKTAGSPPYSGLDSLCSEIAEEMQLLEEDIISLSSDETEVLDEFTDTIDVISNHLLLWMAWYIDVTQKEEISSRWSITMAAQALLTVAKGKGRQGWEEGDWQSLLDGICTHSPGQERVDRLVIVMRLLCALVVERRDAMDSEVVEMAKLIVASAEAWEVDNKYVEVEEVVEEAEHNDDREIKRMGEDIVRSPSGKKSSNFIDQEERPLQRDFALGGKKRLDRKEN